VRLQAGSNLPLHIEDHVLPLVTHLLFHAFGAFTIVSLEGMDVAVIILTRYSKPLVATSHFSPFLSGGDGRVPTFDH
jgi:hypothetical protein